MGHCSTTYFVIVSSNDVMDQDDEPDPINLEETLSEYLTNANLPTRCRTFGKELGVDDAKTLKDIQESFFRRWSGRFLSYNFVLFLLPYLDKYCGIGCGCSCSLPIASRISRNLMIISTTGSCSTRLGVCKPNRDVSERRLRQRLAHS
jgi:hypothetical protein